VRASARRRARNALRVTFTTSSTTVCDASYCACGVVVSESKPDSLKRAASLATDADAAAAESGTDAAGAVGLAALDVDLPNPLAEPGVGEHAVGGTNLGGERPKQAR